MEAIREIPLQLIFGNPDQPRQHFDDDELDALAASIRENGLLQPIKVVARPGPVGAAYMIVCGERRFRAHQRLGAPSIPAIVAENLDDAQIMVEAIIENGQRVNVHPLEEAVAYQRCLDAGISVDDLARRLGLAQPWRVNERVCLLKLRPEYQQLLRKGQLSNSQGYEMAQLSPPGQDALFRAIRGGECQSYAALRSRSLALQQGEAQVAMFEAPRGPCAADKALARALEQRFARLAAALRESVVDNEIVAVAKVDPNRARGLADLLGAMQGDLRRIEQALRDSVEPQPLAA